MVSIAFSGVCSPSASPEDLLRRAAQTICRSPLGFQQCLGHKSWGWLCESFMLTSAGRVALCPQRCGIVLLLWCHIVVLDLLSVLFSGRRRTTCSNHLLYELSTNNFFALAHTQRHVRKKRRVANVRGVGVSNDVILPFVCAGISVASANVFGLEGFELLESSELVGHVE